MMKSKTITLSIDRALTPLTFTPHAHSMALCTSAFVDGATTVISYLRASEKIFRFHYS